MREAVEHGLLQLSFARRREPDPVATADHGHGYGATLEAERVSKLDETSARVRVTLNVVGDDRRSS